jgi:hypothetical protein
LGQTNQPLDARIVQLGSCRSGNLRITPGLLTEAALNLDVGAADRPVAFATPLADANLEPHFTFDASSSASVRRMRRSSMHVWDLPVRQFVLGAEIVKRGATLRHGAFQLSYSDQLLPVLDFWHGEAALSPQLGAAEVEHAVWGKRPARLKGAANRVRSFLAEETLMELRAPQRTQFAAATLPDPIDLLPPLAPRSPLVVARLTSQDPAKCGSCSRRTSMARIDSNHPHGDDAVALERRRVISALPRWRSHR